MKLVYRRIVLLSLSFIAAVAPAQEKDVKNYRISYVAGMDYSRNIHPIRIDYRVSHLPGYFTLTGSGKFCGSMGIRYEYNYRSRNYFMVSGRMIDKGYSVIEEWHGEDNDYSRKRPRYRRFYLSFPVQVVHRMKGNPDAAYLKCGISFDLNIEAEPEYRRISNSLILGAGKSFVINDALRVSLEPTLRYSIYDYGEIFNWIADRQEPYRPVSVGLIIVLDQL